MGMNYLLSTYDYTFVEQVPRTEHLVSGGESESARFITGKQKHPMVHRVYTGRPILIGEGKHANETTNNVGILLNTRLTSVPIYREDAVVI